MPPVGRFGKVDGLGVSALVTENPGGGGGGDAWRGRGGLLEQGVGLLG